MPDVSLCIYPYDFRVRDFREAVTRATLTAKMALTAKMRDCSRFMAWLTLTAKMAANACSKKIADTILAE
jgi:hypothetical protein